MAGSEKGEGKMAEDELAVNKDNTWGSPGLKLFFSLLMVMIVLTAAYFYFFYPTVLIEIEPEVSQFKGSLTLYGSPDINKADRAKGTIPLREMEVEISAEQEIESSGERLVGETEARGKVKFINEDKKPVTIPGGTILESSEGIRFETVSPVEVPGLEIDYLMDLPVGMRAGQAETEVVCLEKGSQGNVGVGSINKMSKGYEDIYLINIEPTYGGSDKRYQVISQSDRDKLRDKLEDYLKDKLITRFYQESGGSYRIIEDELAFSQPKITFSGEVGETAEILRASGTLTARGYVLKNSELNRLIDDLLQEKLAREDRQLIAEIDVTGVELTRAAGIDDAISGSVNQAVSGAENEEAEKLDESARRLYNIKVELSAPVISSFDLAQLSAGLKGSGVEEARAALEAREDIERVVINTDADRLPGLGFALKMAVREPAVKKVYAPGD